jgi:hypothetical protein
LSIIKKAALYFARKEFCRNAINERADLSVLKKKHTAAVSIGLFLIVFSYLIVIPAFFIIGLIAAWLKKPMVGVIGVPLAYGISWLLLMLGLYLAGPKYGKALGRWAVRVILEKILGDEAKTISPLPQENSKSDTTKN